MTDPEWSCHILTASDSQRRKMSQAPRIPTHPHARVLHTVHHCPSRIVQDRPGMSWHVQACNINQHHATSCNIYNILQSSSIINNHLRASSTFINHHHASSYIIIHQHTSSTFINHHHTSSCNIIHYHDLSCIYNTFVIFREYMWIHVNASERFRMIQNVN